MLAVLASVRPEKDLKIALNGVTSDRYVPFLDKKFPVFTPIAIFLRLENSDHSLARLRKCSGVTVNSFCRPVMKDIPACIIGEAFSKVLTNVEAAAPPTIFHQSSELHKEFSNGSIPFVPHRSGTLYSQPVLT